MPDTLTGGRPVCRNLMVQFAHYSVEYGGETHIPVSGTPRGYDLGLLISALLPHHINNYYLSLNPDRCFLCQIHGLLSTVCAQALAAAAGEIF